MTSYTTNNLSWLTLVRRTPGHAKDVEDLSLAVNANQRNLVRGCHAYVAEATVYARDDQFEYTSIITNIPIQPSVVL